MTTRLGMTLLLASSSLTGLVCYHWGQRTERQSFVQQETAAEQALLQKIRTDPHLLQWDQIQQDITGWAALCSASSLRETQRATGCFMKGMAEWKQAEFVKKTFEEQLARPPALTMDQREGRSR